jgi:hypothetical protein
MPSALFHVRSKHRTGESHLAARPTRTGRAHSRSRGRTTTPTPGSGSEEVA